MYKVFTNARTVWVGDLKVENKVGADGKPYESKTILLKVASNRDYSVSKVVNGETSKVRPADFVFCKANGHIAQLIADYASGKSADGKLISRFVSLSGHLETYVTQKTINIEKVISINGAMYKVPFSEVIDIDQTTFVIREIEFLDSSEKSNNARNTNQIVEAVPAEGVPTEGVIAVTPQQIQQPAQTPVQQPVVQQAPIQQPAQTVAQQPVQPVVQQQPAQQVTQQPVVQQPVQEAGAEMIATAELPDVEITEPGGCPF